MIENHTDVEIIGSGIIINLQHRFSLRPILSTRKRILRVLGNSYQIGIFLFNHFGICLSLITNGIYRVNTFSVVNDDSCVAN